MHRRTFSSLLLSLFVCVAAPVSMAQEVESFTDIERLSKKAYVAFMFGYGINWEIAAVGFLESMKRSSEVATMNEFERRRFIDDLEDELRAAAQEYGEQIEVPIELELPVYQREYRFSTNRAFNFEGQLSPGYIELLVPKTILRAGTNLPAFSPPQFQISWPWYMNTGAGFGGCNNLKASGEESGIFLCGTIKFIIPSDEIAEAFLTPERVVKLSGKCTFGKGFTNNGNYPLTCWVNSLIAVISNSELIMSFGNGYSFSGYPDDLEAVSTAIKEAVQLNPNDFRQHYYALAKSTSGPGGDYQLCKQGFSNTNSINWTFDDCFDLEVTY